MTIGCHFFISYFFNRSSQDLLNQYVGQNQNPTYRGKVQGSRENQKGSRGKREGRKGQIV